MFRNNDVDDKCMHYKTNKIYTRDRRQWCMSNICSQERELQIITDVIQYVLR